MKKANVFRSALAMGMAFTLAAAPMSAMAESVLDGQELVENMSEAVEEKVEDTVDQSADLASSAYEMFTDITIGEAMYNTISQKSGVDMSWLQYASAYVQTTPTDTGYDAELTLDVNEVDVMHVIASLDLSAGMLYLHIPEMFEQAAAIDLQALMQAVASSEEQAEETAAQSEEETAVADMVTQMLMNMLMPVIADGQEFFASIPAETWQEELVNYMMVFMSKIEANEETGSITVGNLEADVKAQTYTISQENMGAMFSELFTALANDPILEAFLTSDFMNTGMSIVSMFTGLEGVTGETILEEVRNVLNQAASADYSDIPGVSLTICNNDMNTAGGFSFDLISGTEKYNVASQYGIVTESENAFQLTPSPMLLSMCGLDSSNAVDIQAAGTNADGLLNEEINVIVNDKTAVVINLENIDIEAIRTRGQLIGRIHVTADNMDTEVVYGFEDDGTRTVEQLMNGESMYRSTYWSGNVECAEMDVIDYENAAVIDSIDKLGDYFGTINVDPFLDTLADAGVPLGSKQQTAA